MKGRLKFSVCDCDDYSILEYNAVREDGGSQTTETSMNTC
jgi:hypothetical protein